MDHRLLLPGRRPRRSSTTAGCGPATSGTLDDYGFMQITDRTKDVIKSGGEWISSVELENALMAHPDVIEAAVVGVPDERWAERPLAVVVLSAGSTPDAPTSLREWLTARVARWWLPERWAFIDEIPKTSVGKFDKKVCEPSTRRAIWRSRSSRPTTSSPKPTHRYAARRENRSAVFRFRQGRPRHRRMVPRGRIGSPEDVAGAVIYLCSRAGAYLTGVAIPVDGGISSHG